MSTMLAKFAPFLPKTSFKPVFRSRIHRIHMFLGLPDPDPLVEGMDPDPDPSILWLFLTFYL